MIIRRETLTFLRPCLTRASRPLKPEYANAYICLQRRFTHSLERGSSSGQNDVEKQKRLDQLSKTQPLAEYYPSLVNQDGVQNLTIRQFKNKYNDIEGDIDHLVTTLGRLRSVRLLGAKLMFLDIERNAQRVQVMVDKKKIKQEQGTDNIFANFKKVVRTGDWISVEGNPTRTSSGQLSIVVRKVPEIVAPCLHHLPEKVDDPETLARYPHIHQLTSGEPQAIIQLRALVYNYTRVYFNGEGFLEVETPIFDVNAGGAIARPFETIANELSNMPIRLRIAPELNLKRLVIGGADRIFEIGRVFRNEGVDNTHNPEFSTCEFYEVGATLTDVIQRTEEFLNGLRIAVEELRPKHFPSLTMLHDIDFTPPFAQLPFIPTIEKASGQKLPDLSSSDAASNLINMFDGLKILVPPNPTLPRLLDTLAEVYIEPLCQNPTFITHHPEALSPLSKSFLDPVSGQRIASRVELFISGREYINAYEEENSPFEQRRKFEQQFRFHPAGEGIIDESYLEALEWGMPPTGGWGCGLDRLIMLFAGKKRIADVLPFGTLRNVVSIAKNK